MRFLRILCPFLFVRNWYSGEYELSRARVGLFIAFLGLFGIATAIVIVLQTPLEYASSV